MFKFSLTSLEMSDGSLVPVPESGVVVLVGPNNAGKSAALKDIATRVSNESPTDVVKAVNATKTGTEEQLDEWLHQQAHPQLDSGQLYFWRGGRQVHRGNALSWWNQEHLRELATFFILLLRSEDRLGLANSMANFDPRSQWPSGPLQTLYVRPDLEQELSTAAHEAFGLPVMLDRFAGNQLHLLIGDSPATPATIPPTLEYLDELRAIPPVHTQGDGVRSFIGVMLALVAARYPVVLIDEPEAFLHPPQARLLGRKLRALTPEGTQVIVATHSSDLLQGVLEGQGGAITIARITRTADKNPTAVLQPEDVSKLWEDPLLRYSRILDALFYRGVVVCESDADCRFYNAVLDVEHQANDKGPSDLLFTHCGGKHRMPVVVRALAAVNVPTRVIADFDVLKEEKLLADIVRSLGGDWTDQMATDWKATVSGVAQLARRPSVAVVRTEIEAALNGVTGPIDDKTAQAVRDACKTDDGWAAVKRSGLAGLPQGETQARCAELLAALRDIGLFVVEVGELERFVPEVPGHGPAWCSAVLSEGRHATAMAARKFTAELTASFG